MASMQFAAAERAPIAIPKKVQEAINEDKQTKSGRSHVVLWAKEL